MQRKSAKKWGHFNLFYYYHYWISELMRVLFQLQCRMSCQIKRLNENFEQAQLRIMGLTTQVQTLRHSTSSTGEGDADPTETECLCKTMFENPWRPTNCTIFSLFVICLLTELTKRVRRRYINNFILFWKCVGVFVSCLYFMRVLYCNKFFDCTWGQVERWCVGFY